MPDVHFDDQVASLGLQARHAQTAHGLWCALVALGDLHRSRQVVRRRRRAVVTGVSALTAAVLLTAAIAASGGGLPLVAVLCVALVAVPAAVERLARASAITSRVLDESLDLGVVLAGGLGALPAALVFQRYGGCEYLRDLGAQHVLLRSGPSGLDVAVQLAQDGFVGSVDDVVATSSALVRR